MAQSKKDRMRDAAKLEAFYESTAKGAGKKSHTYGGVKFPLRYNFHASEPQPHECRTECPQCEEKIAADGTTRNAAYLAACVKIGIHVNANHASR